MKLTILLLLSILSSSLYAISGNYKFELNLKNAKLPFIINFKTLENNTIATLYNGEEKILLGEVKTKKNEITIPIQTYNAALVGKIDSENNFQGHWIKFDRTPEYRVPFTAKPTQDSERIKFPKNNKKVSSEWKISFIDKKGKIKNKLLVLRRKEGRIYGSVAGTTGDYRFLEGSFEDDSFKLYGFDGIFAFVFDGKLIDKKIEGTMYSGKSFSQKFVASIDKSFKLPDANKISKVNSKSLFFKLKDVNGKEMNVDKNFYQDKVTILQIFGSWCPNCIDETNFIKKWKKTNRNLNVQFLGLSFERSPNKKHAIKMVKKAIKKLKIDYPFLMAGYTDKDKVSSVLPSLENFSAFPTTIYIDKKGLVRKVHTGFNGPATGKLFTQFEEEFTSFIKLLDAE